MADRESGEDDEKFIAGKQVGLVEEVGFGGALAGGCTWHDHFEGRPKIWRLELKETAMKNLLGFTSQTKSAVWKIVEGKHCTTAKISQHKTHGKGREGG